MYECVCVHMCAFICVCLNVSMCICELKIVPKASFMVGKYSTTNGNHRFKNILYLALYTRDNTISNGLTAMKLPRRCFTIFAFMKSLRSFAYITRKAHLHTG